MDKESQEIKSLVLEPVYYKGLIYRYNDDYIFFTTYDSVFNNLKNEIYVYVVKSKTVEKININLKGIGLPNELSLRFDNADIFEDILYFPTYPKRYGKYPNYILSYNFRTLELRKMFKLNDPALEIFIDGGYLYFESGTIYGNSVAYRIKLK